MRSRRTIAMAPLPGAALPRAAQPRAQLPLAALLLAALLLRAIVPVGLMPSAVADGGFLTLCPERFGSAAITALLGESAHHVHHHHGVAADQDPASNPERCALGEGLASAVAVDAPALELLALAPAVFDRPVTLRTPDQPARQGYQARAPPARHSA
jgi:hypothetical protein